MHEPAFGRPHHVTDLVTTTDASRIVVTGSVYDELDGLPRTALYEVRDGALRALTSGGGSAKAARFAPDGSALAFLSDRAKADVFQLYLLADGQLGEARPAPGSPRHGRVSRVVTGRHPDPARGRRARSGDG